MSNRREFFGSKVPGGTIIDRGCRVFVSQNRRGIKLAGSVGVCFWDPIVRGEQGVRNGFL